MRVTAITAALTAAVAFALGFGAAHAVDNDSPGFRTPGEVVGAFVYHIDRGNFGKACGLMTREAGGPVESCSEGFIYNAAMNLVIFGVDIYEGAKLLPGEPRELKNGSLVYQIKTNVLPPVKVAVAKQESGRYRITRIG